MRTFTIIAIIVAFLTVGSSIYASGYYGWWLVALHNRPMMQQYAKENKNTVRWGGGYFYGSGGHSSGSSNRSSRTSSSTSRSSSSTGGRSFRGGGFSGGK